MGKKKLEELQTKANDLDRYKVRKLYPDATDDDRKQEWYFDMDKGEKTERLRNYEDANLIKEDDGSWSVTGAKKLEGEGDNAKWDDKGQVRLEGWSESGSKKWLNMEITLYAFLDKELKGKYEKKGEWVPFSPGPYAFQLYGRGGHHGSSDRCEGACYKIGLLRKDDNKGKVEVRKEPTHPCYLNDKGLEKGTDKDVDRRWIGLKQVVYNFKKDGRTCVANEIWIDDESDDEGKLSEPLRNNWRNVSNVNDTGEWGDGGSNFTEGCPLLDSNEKEGTRKREHIINKPGGTNMGNIGSLRSDEVKLRFKYFSIREIEPPEPHKDAVVA